MKNKKLIEQQSIGRMFRPAHQEPVKITFIDYPQLLKSITMDKEQHEKYLVQMKNIKCPICDILMKKGN